MEGEPGIATTEPADDRRAELVDAIGRLARELAPGGEPPIHGAGAETWSALVAVADQLNGSGAHAVGRPAFLGDALLRALIEEARRQLPAGLGNTRATGAAGDTLAAVAVSRQLRDVVSGAHGFPVVPTHDALYEYDPPGSHVATHLDSRDYPIVFHLLLEHTRANEASAESVLIAHLPRSPAPTRLRLRRGEGLVLRGRGTIHSWQPLGGDEQRILLAVGFAPE